MNKKQFHYCVDRVDIYKNAIKLNLYFLSSSNKPIYLVVENWRVTVANINEIYRNSDTEICLNNRLEIILFLTKTK